MTQRRGSMRRVLACVVFGVLPAGAEWPAPQAFAQQDEVEEQQKAAEFARLHELWQQVRDPEEKIALGEQALALEPPLKNWPLQDGRDRIIGRLLSEVGFAYDDRGVGDRADNLEKAIAAYEAALTVLTREASEREWAATQNNLGLAYERRIRGDRADNLEKAIATADRVEERR